MNTAANMKKMAPATGRSVERIVKEWTMPAKYSGYAAPQPARLQANVEGVYKETR